MKNYIPDVNKFKLSGPPDWWLRGLWEFDPSLVVIPSRQGFMYRLAQRRKLNLAAKFVNDMMATESDTKMLASYGLIPVTTILATACWSPMMFQELAERAPWRNGGAEKVINHVEGREHEKQRAIARQTEQRNTDYAKAGWRHYQARTGARTFIDRAKAQTPESPRIVLAG